MTTLAPNGSAVTHVVRWRTWLLLAIGVWIFPAGMTGIWGSCYTEVFGEPPCGAWAEKTITGLFLLNFPVIAFFVWRSVEHPLRLGLAVVLSAVEVAVTWSVWFFGGLSVAGFYF